MGDARLPFRWVEKRCPALFSLSLLSSFYPSIHPRTHAQPCPPVHHPLITQRPRTMSGFFNIRYKTCTLDIKLYCPSPPVPLASSHQESNACHVSPPCQVMQERTLQMSRWLDALPISRIPSLFSIPFFLFSFSLTRSRSLLPLFSPSVTLNWA